jgi:hypothetical protein
LHLIILFVQMTIDVSMLTSFFISHWEQSFDISFGIRTLSAQFWRYFWILHALFIFLFVWIGFVVRNFWVPSECSVLKVERWRLKKCWRNVQFFFSFALLIVQCEFAENVHFLNYGRCYIYIHIMSNHFQCEDFCFNF